MTYRARNHLEREVLESFDDKLQENEAVEADVADIICETLESTTLSQPSEAVDVADKLVEETSLETR